MSRLTALTALTAPTVMHAIGSARVRQLALAAVLVVSLAPCACRPCTWPAQVGWDAPELNRDAFRAGVVFEPPRRGHVYSWERLYLRYPRRWLQAAGLYDLSQVTLPVEAVEVRIWEHFDPHTRYRGTIIQKRGDSFRGAEMYLMAGEPDHCAGWAVGLEPCADWESAWSELLDSGLMELPDSTELPAVKPVEDGLGYIVEIQAEGNYRTYHYDNPEYAPWSEARRIEKIVEVVRRRILCHEQRLGSEQSRRNEPVRTGGVGRCSDRTMSEHSIPSAPPT